MQNHEFEFFFAQNSKYLSEHKKEELRQVLLNVDATSDRLTRENQNLYYNPTLVFIFSFFLGCLGMDRFIIGDTGMGVLKLLTVGGCGIIGIYDWFTIMERTRKKNTDMLISKYSGYMWR